MALLKFMLQIIDLREKRQYRLIRNCQLWQNGCNCYFDCITKSKELGHFGRLGTFALGLSRSDKTLRSLR